MPRSTPIESLHTILLGPTKYLLQRLMDRLPSQSKDEIEAKIDSLSFSGLDGKIKGSSICRSVNLCYNKVILTIANSNLRYSRSLVGGDYKLWSQVGIFIVWPYLTKFEQAVWLALAKVYSLML